MTHDDLRWAVDRFRRWVRPGEDAPFFRRITAFSWWREPDYRSDYCELHQLESDLSDGEPPRFELLSIWRLARDASYAAWAKSVGTDACQITLFGLGESHDWFVRRRGSFRESILATERLLDAGIRPRWQLFLTRTILRELPAILRMADRMDLGARTAALGGEFVIFAHTPGPEGEAWNIEHLRPTVEDIAQVPAALLASSRRHLGADLGRAEGEIVEELLAEDPRFPSAYAYPDKLGFYITSDWDVYANMGEMAPWWRIGNLLTEPLDAIIGSLEDNRPLGYQTIFGVSAAELARRFGRPGSRLLYDPGDLRARWARMWCAERFRDSSGQNREIAGQ